MKEIKNKTPRKTGRHAKRIPESLNRQWRWAALLGLALEAGFGMILQLAGHADMLLGWLLASVPVVVGVLILFRLNLCHNHRPNESVLLDTLGPGNWITLLRAVMIGWLGGFWGVPRYSGTCATCWLDWLPGLIYLLAVVADYMDGLVARLSEHETRLGEIMDTQIDALGLVVGPLLAIRCGQLPVYYLGVSAAYYLFILGIWIRKKQSKLVFGLEPRPAARLAAGFQMGLVAAALLPVWGPPATTLAATLFMMPFLVGFCNDWMAVCGLKRANTTGILDWVLKFRKRFATWLPAFIRIVLLGTGILSVQRSPAVSQILGGSWTEGFSLRQGFVLVLFCMLIFGVMGRTAAFFFSLWAGRNLTVSGGTLELKVLLGCGLILLLTGTGSLSIWQPEVHFLFEKAGRRKKPVR